MPMFLVTSGEYSDFGIVALVEASSRMDVDRVVGRYVAVWEEYRRLRNEIRAEARDDMDGWADRADVIAKRRGVEMPPYLDDAIKASGLRLVSYEEVHVGSVAG